MLSITIPGEELWDESREEFISRKPQILMLEHSLVSLSKWESRWNKPFLSREQKTRAELLDYIRCMTITQNVDRSVYERLSSKHISQIQKYMDASMTATRFGDSRKGSNRAGRITSEVIYCQMIALGIPFECQKWHLNRLLTLIKVCDIRSRPNKKMSKRETRSRYAALNAKNRAKYNSRG